VRSHRIALVPTAAQEVLLRQAVGVSRFAYNWALAEWKRQYQAGEKPSEAALRRQLIYAADFGKTLAARR
jgi:putative transposase